MGNLKTLIKMRFAAALVALLAVTTEAKGGKPQEVVQFFCADAKCKEKCKKKVFKSDYCYGDKKKPFGVEFDIDGNQGTVAFYGNQKCSGKPKWAPTVKNGACVPVPKKKGIYTASLWKEPKEDL